MQAAIYERTGPAREGLHLGELPDPVPAAGELRVRLQWSGLNPSDLKSRAGRRSSVLTFPRIAPHSDGTGVIDAVGHCAVQFARRLGAAQVIASVNGAAKARLARGAGADATIAEPLPLARIADAHELVEQGRATGNVVLEIP